MQKSLPPLTFASGQPVAARCQGCLFLSWVPLLSPLGKKTAAKWGEWRKTFLTIMWYLEVINKQTDTFDYGKVCIKHINHQESNRKFAVHIKHEGPGKSPSNQPLSPQKTEETRQFRGALAHLSQDKHKFKLQGLVLPTTGGDDPESPSRPNQLGSWQRRAVARERQTLSKAYAWKGLWVQLGEDKPPQSLTAPPMRRTLGFRHQGHSNWGHCLRRGSWTHETNLRTIRVKNSVKQLMNNFIAVPYGHPIFAVLG